jgi:RNA polymerase-binding protein DksA
VTKKTTSKPAAASTKAASKTTSKAPAKPASKAPAKPAEKPASKAAAGTSAAKAASAKAPAKPGTKAGSKATDKAAPAAPAKGTPSAAAKAPSKGAPKKTAAVSKPAAEKPAPAKTDGVKPAAVKPAAAKSEAKERPAAKDPAAGKKASSTPTKPEPTQAKGDANAAASAKGVGSIDKPETDDKSARKGITIVTPKPPAKKSGKSLEPYKSPIPSLATAGGMPRRPLIASGPKNRLPDQLTPIDDASRLKSPFGKKDLAAFRDILLAKRAQLLGDVQRMEDDALRSGSGGLSNLPQHLAEQGSDTSDQSLSLGLAETDRKLIKEIDAALDRIEAGTYGCCELTGKPISRERLEELPWARYSIEAARQVERLNFIGPRG